MHLLTNAIRGALIGTAELVPGISGGTVALIVGIYVRALRNADNLVKLKFRNVEWDFLISLAVGMFTAVFGLSKLLSGFVDSQFSASHALFFGMVFVSIIVPFLMLDAKQLRQASTYIAFLTAALAVFFLTGLSNGVVQDPPLLVVFFAASIAICALVLPGMSGSLILLTMGLYHPIIRAVSERDLTVLLVFMAGALCGLIAFVRVLNYLLDNHRAPTLGAMAGFMLGSLRALWPFGDEQDASLAVILGCFIFGAVLVGAFIYADRIKKAHT
ncbi:membrane protein [Corynebacterium phocae]|uniref:Membrane protein n=1 Tax=Corynebacterium phocae TaxID=161895 RepID=A0A1L7D3V8_9CORY|nr:DUF368 domain-containing protein [Corynebacterium phocae]APT92612.1 membrane protein [Corynebacterium phocae]KAA8724168.1 DUF368 domain-containing protein [Corynebacterium phocae]